MVHSTLTCCYLGLGLLLKVAYVAEIQSDYTSPYHLVALEVFQGRDQKVQISKISLHYRSGFINNYTKPKEEEKMYKVNTIRHAHASL